MPLDGAFPLPQLADLTHQRLVDLQSPLRILTHRRSLEFL